MSDIIDTALRRMIDQKRYDCGAACCEWWADGDAEEALVAYGALLARADAAEARVTELRGLLAECYSQTGHLLTSDFADEVRSAALAKEGT